MNRTWVCFFLLIAAASAMSCGSSGRHLESIAIQRAANGQQLQFTATGTFSAPPTTVSPLPVFWGSAPPPPDYTLTTDPYVFDCANANPVQPGPLVAFAPSDPKAPSSGSITKTRMVTATTSISCQ